MSFIAKIVCTLVVVTSVAKVQGTVRRETTDIIIAEPAGFRGKMFSHILGNITRKLLNMPGFFEEMLSNLFGNISRKFHNMFEKWIDKRIFFGNLIGKLPSMFEKQIERIPSMFVNLPNKFSNIFEILRGVFGHVRDIFGRNYCSDIGCDRCRFGKTGNKRISCSTS